MFEVLVKDKRKIIERHVFEDYIRAIDTLTMLSELMDFKYTIEFKDKSGYKTHRVY